MSTPIFEKEQYSFPAFQSSQAPQPQSQSQPQAHGQREHRSSDEDGTLQGEDSNHLRITTSYASGPDYLTKGASRSPTLLSAQCKQVRRLDDDFMMLHAEYIVSTAEKSAANGSEDIGRSKSIAKSRSRTAGEPVNDFDVGTMPIYEKTKIYQPPANPTMKLAKFFKRIHNSSFLVRYFFYILPVTLLLLNPLLFRLLLFNQATIRGVRLFWFGIWLEIIWLTLWAARILAKAIPWPMGMISSMFTNNSKKWRDLRKALEVPATLFFWWLAIEISFLPTIKKNHHLDKNTQTKD